MKSVFCLYCNKEIHKGELDYPVWRQDDKSFFHTRCYDAVLLTLWNDPEYRRLMEQETERTRYWLQKQ